LDRALAEQFAACGRKFGNLFNAMTELSRRLPAPEKGKRLRQILSTCWIGLEEETNHQLRRDYPDLFVYRDIQELRKIAWSLCDPLGLAASGCLRGDYDAYLLEATELLATGESEEGIAPYLAKVADVRMGLGSAGRANAARTAKALTDYYRQLKP
jgi:hypothetical protein